MNEVALCVCLSLGLEETSDVFFLLSQTSIFLFIYFLVCRFITGGCLCRPFSLFFPSSSSLHPTDSIHAIAMNRDTFFFFYFPSPPLFLFLFFLCV